VYRAIASTKALNKTVACIKDDRVNPQCWLVVLRSCERRILEQYMRYLRWGCGWLPGQTSRMPSTRPNPPSRTRGIDVRYKSIYQQSRDLVHILKRCMMNAWGGSWLEGINAIQVDTAQVHNSQMDNHLNEHRVDACCLSNFMFQDLHGTSTHACTIQLVTSTVMLWYGLRSTLQYPSQRAPQNSLLAPVPL